MIITLANLHKGGLMDKLPEKKTCCDCTQEKPIKDFAKEPTMKDGRAKRCRTCEKNRQKKAKTTLSEYAKEFFVHDNFYK